MAAGDFRYGYSHPLRVPYYRFHDTESVAGHEFDVLLIITFASSVLGETTVMER